MPYTKPHLPYDEQVATLCRRGLGCPDPDAARALLQAVGYYRLSAYVYPFRELLPEDERQRVSPVHYRSDGIKPGTTMAHVEELWRFDRRLRLLCLDAIETVEIGIRTKVAHVLGARDPFGHVNREALDETACSARTMPQDPTSPDAFDDWIERYQRLQEHAKAEDFVRHNLHKYGSPLPIWIGIEFLDMGALVRLYSLLDKRDQNKIANQVGVRGGPLLGAWLKQINYLRNVCAHHSRLWNRTLTYSTRHFKEAQVDEPLRHVASSKQRDKVYVLLAILAYLVRNIDGKSNWPLALRTQLRKFPDVPAISPQADMGFPDDWERLPLWKAPPGRVVFD